ncbi:MAG: Gx transporter family protein [Coprococcus sp.]|nr:Gx transporter family protein [Coprococcus sp.]
MKTKAAYLGVFTALALIFSYIETLLPLHPGIPGAKLGVANLVVIVALYKMGEREALAVSASRIVLAGFLFGNLVSILYSLAGGMLSFAVMAFARKRDIFSVYGVSMAGGVFHNMGQIAAAVAVLDSYSVTYYIPVLLVIGVFTGTLIGIVAAGMLKRLAALDIRI